LGRSTGTALPVTSGGVTGKATWRLLTLLLFQHLGLLGLHMAYQVHKLADKIGPHWEEAVRGTKISLQALEDLMESLEPAFRVPIFGSARLNQREHPDYWRFVYLLCFWLAFHGIDVVTGYGPGVMEAATVGAKAGAKARSRYCDDGDHAPIVVGLPLHGLPQEKPLVGADLKLSSSVFGLRLMAFRLFGLAAVSFWGGYGADLENKDWLQHSQQVDRLVIAAKESGYTSDVLSKNPSVLLGWRPPLILADLRWYPSVLQADLMLRHGTISSEDILLWHFPYTPEEISSFLETFPEILSCEDTVEPDRSLLGWLPPTTTVEQEVERILKVVLRVRDDHSAFLRSKGITPKLPSKQPDRSVVCDSDFGI
jgi:predicted Rossmann-fold nucleotide-binding protein